ncbi:MAG: aminoacyl-tRNA hydrolase [Deltaproteobacteria bacterium]|nr:aminoacyl-tRNA hydrolase [Deltaproteobacteria bacterium]
MKIIVGLGNPGSQYEGSRHNIGFMVVDRLATIHHIRITTKRFKALFGKGLFGPQEVVLIKPMTFMNRSGEAVNGVLQFYHYGPENLIVIHDDLDLSLGRLRFKMRGGDGGHLGVRSIIESIGANNFLRLKVGVGRPPKGMDPASYVLGAFPLSEEDDLNRVLDQATEAIKVMLLDGVQTAMNRFQKKIRLEEG